MKTYQSSLHIWIFITNINSSSYSALTLTLKTKLQNWEPYLIGQRIFIKLSSKTSKNGGATSNFCDPRFLPFPRSPNSLISFFFFFPPHSLYLTDCYITANQQECLWPAWFMQQNRLPIIGWLHSILYLPLNHT